MIDVVILTLNEALHLRDCLRSLGWAKRVYVVDSGSSDETTEIARQEGAVVRENPFESFARQRNWALDNLPFESKWVLFLDADERATSDFEIAVCRAVKAASEEIAGFYCCWKLMLDGVWLKRSDNFPKWQLRLVINNRARFIDFGHGQKEGVIDGVLGYIKEPYLHFAFCKGWKEWWERHKRYVVQEAEVRLRGGAGLCSLTSKDGSRRNVALRLLVSRIPGWPVMRFVFSYLVRMGLLEGRAGYTYCRNMARYERMIQIEMQRRRAKFRKRKCGGAKQG